MYRMAKTKNNNNTKQTKNAKISNKTAVTPSKTIKTTIEITAITQHQKLEYTNKLFLNI